MPVGIFIFCLRHYFVAPAGRDGAGCFSLSTVLTGMLQFFMSYTMALLAFWLLEVSTFIFIVFAFEYHCRRPFVSVEHPAARRWSGARIARRFPICCIFR